MNNPGAGRPPKMHTDNQAFKMFCGSSNFKPEKQKLTNTQKKVYDCISKDPSIKNAIKELGMKDGAIRSLIATIKSKGWFQ